MKKRIIKKVLPVLLYGIIPLSVMLYLLLSELAGEKKFTLYPGSNIQTGTFGDYDEYGGNSFINSFDVTRQRIIFTYTLKSGFINPYAGFTVRSNGWINLKPFDVLKIKAGSTHSHSIRVFLFTKIPGYTIDKDFSTYLHLQKEIALQNDCPEYTVMLADLYIPDWWYEKKLSENDPRLIRDFTGVYSVSIQSGTTQPVDIADTITVEEISFYKSNHTLFVMLISLFIFYAFVIFAFFRLKQYKNRLAKKIGKVVLACRDISPEQSFDEEARKIIKYIGENYCKHDLSVDTVSRACCVQVIKIPQYIKKYFDLTLEMHKIFNV